MGRKTERALNPTSGAQSERRGPAEKRHAREQERAQDLGFLELAKEVAREHAEALRLLAKN